MTGTTTLAAPQGTFELRRSVRRTEANLRAWDAADEYVLAHLAESGVPAEAHVLVLNDGFGALACALAAWSPTSMSDSVVAREASIANLSMNGLDPGVIDHLPSIADPPAPVDVLVIKIPRSLALLEDQLHRVGAAIGPHTHVVGAGMTKMVHNSTLDLFERLIGPTATSLARKKARLIFSEVRSDRLGSRSPYPSSFCLSSGEEVVCHAGVFSQGRLDNGTALLLDHLPTDLGAAHVVDLGCGSGVLGLRAGVANPAAQVTFLDSSYMAVASARATWHGRFGDDRPAHFSVADGLAEVAPGSVDLVLNNPPFHADRSMGDAVAWQMFRDAHRCLRPGGVLMVVGNRHLGYHTKLKRLFGNGETVASNPKFVVLRSTKDATRSLVR